MQIHFYKDIFTAFAIIIVKAPQCPEVNRGVGGGGRHGHS